MVNILIVDDHSITRIGLEMILEIAIRHCRITHAGNGDEVMKLVRDNNYHLVILDLNLPSTDSDTLFKHILAVREEQKILIFSMNPERIFGLRYLRLGAYGYLEKSANDDTVVRAVKLILKGNKYFSELLLDELVSSSVAAVAKTPFDSLTDREFEIARHLIRGLGVGEIAKIVKVHTSTVGTQRARIFEKTGVRNAMELNQLARLHHIITD